MNIKHLFTGKKLITAVLSLFISLFGIQSSYADYYPSGPQQNVSEQTLIDNGWTKFYEQTYATVTSTAAGRFRILTNGLAFVTPTKPAAFASTSAAKTLAARIKSSIGSCARTQRIFFACDI